MRSNKNQSPVCSVAQDAPGAVSRWFVYMLECCDGTIYTGCTTDISRRLNEHNFSARGAKYTRSRRPVKLLCNIECADRSSALREEMRIKRLTRAQKLELVNMRSQE